MENKKIKNPDRLGFGKFMAWQSRGVSLAINAIIITYIQIYCTDMLGLAPALVGTLLLATKIIDGFTDLFAGFLVDRTHTKLGKGRPYEFAIIGTWFCTWLLFSVPEGITSTVVKCAWVVICYTMVNSIFNTLLYANQNVYMVRSFKNEKHYVTLNAYGGIVVMFVAIIFNVTWPLAYANMATSLSGWSMLMGILAIPLLIIGLMRFLFVKETNDVDAGQTQKIDFKEVVNVLKTNPYIYFVAFMYLVYSLINGMNAGVYYFTYVVGDVAMMSVTGITALIPLVSMVFYGPMLKKMSTARLVQFFVLWYIPGGLICWFAKGNVMMFVLGGLFTGCASMPIAYLSNLLVFDCADYNEWKGHARMEGTMSSVISFGGKLGSALGSWLLGIMLSLSGYNGDLAAQEAPAYNMIRALNSLIPMFLYAVIAVLLIFYKLDKMIPQIKQENEEKRQKAIQTE